MKCFRMVLRSTLVTGVMFLTFCSGCLFHFTEKPDCQQILLEMPHMADSMILNYGDYEVMYPPRVYCAGDYMDNIFAVPEKNAVGTNDIDNAVSLLRFKTDSEIDRQVVKKNFMEMVTGPFDFCFLPVWSDKEIAYSQSKGFLLINHPILILNDFCTI